MKIISFAAIKGGVGKTTLAFNFGEWLASQKYNVLFIDLDHQCNLTQTYGIYNNTGTVSNVFTREGEGDVEIVRTKENISIIPGFMRLDSIEKDLENKGNKDMLLYMWLQDNYDKYELGNYDYIIIDCHPDFSTVTRNAIAVSHYVLSPIIPSDFGYNAKFNLENRLQDFRGDVINYLTRESYITAKLLFIANMVKHNTNSSNELLKQLNNEQIASIPYKELFNRSTLDKISISEMANNKQLYQTHKNFFIKYEESMSQIESIFKQDF